MFDRVLSVLGVSGQDYTPKDVAAAVAGLYFHMISADGIIKSEEMDEFNKLLSEQFELSEQDLSEIIEKGVQEDRSSPSIFPFTAILNREFDKETRLQIISRLEKLAEVDGVVHPLEGDMLDHVRRLLNVDG